MLAGPVLTTLFQHGIFSASDTYMASLSLMAYMFGLPGFILIKILVPGYYARQDTRTPVRIGIIAMITNMVMNICFVVPMVLYEYEAPHVGLALATSLAAYLNAFMLYRGLRKTSVLQPTPGWAKLLVQITLAVICMAIMLIFITPELDQWTRWPLLERASTLLGVIAIAGLIYFAVLALLGLRPGQLHRH